MIKTNYHTHCYLCQHAQGLPSDYIKLALKAGYTEIGISDHGPLFKEWTYRMNLNDFFDIYLPDINKGKAKYGDKIKIYSGLEIEYFPQFDNHYRQLLKWLDYLILGQHVVMTASGLNDIYSEMTEELIELYKEEVIGALQTGMFRILAHPDIYLFGYRTWNKTTEKIAAAIIESAIANDVFLEINANGIRRGPIINQDNENTYIYPRLEFWRLVKRYPEAKIIIGEDNHAFNHVDDEACRRARQFAADMGLKPQIYLFGESNE